MIKGMGTLLPAVKSRLEAGSFDCLWLLGDHRLLPQTPTGCIFPAVTGREYVGAPRRLEAAMNVYVVIYHADLTNNKAEDALEHATFVDSIVDHLEEDETFDDDLVINTLVPRIDYGEAQLSRNRYSSSRLTLQVTSRYNIGA